MMKKWEKVIIKTYFQKLLINDGIYDKILEKYNDEEVVKSIISEMKLKLKDLEYIIKKQWQILKKFNLQEKIYREESKHLSESEKEKTEEIYRDTIEKLTAAHIGGFEPVTVLKTKIINKIQQKYDIKESNLNELKNIFKEPKNMEEEDGLLKSRHEAQINVYIHLN